MDRIKIVMFLLSLITASIIYIDVYFLLHSKIDSLFFSIFFSISINLLTLPTFGFMNYSLAIHNKINENFYKNISEKTINSLYEIFLIRYFKSLVTFNNKKNIYGKIHDFLKVKAIKAKESEISHLFPIPFILIIVYYFKNNNQDYLSFFTLFFSIPFHIMPIILQRRNRFIIQRLIKYFD